MHYRTNSGETKIADRHCPDCRGRGWVRRPHQFESGRFNVDDDCHCLRPLRKSSDLPARAYERGYRINHGTQKAESPEEQIRCGLRAGWRISDIIYFMKETGIAPDAIQRAVENVRRIAARNVTAVAAADLFAD